MTDKWHIVKDRCGDYSPYDWVFWHDNPEVGDEHNGSAESFEQAVHVVVTVDRQIRKLDVR